MFIIVWLKDNMFYTEQILDPGFFLRFLYMISWRGLFLSA